MGKIIRCDDNDKLLEILQELDDDAILIVANRSKCSDKEMLETAELCMKQSATLVGLGPREWASMLCLKGLPPDTEAEVAAIENRDLQTAIEYLLRYREVESNE